MNSIDDLGALMKQLDEPAPPASLRANVMARIARDADLRRAAASEGTVPVRSHERPVWLWTLAGLAIILSASLYGWLEAGSLWEVISPRIGPGSRAGIPLEGPAALLIGVGMLIYLAGLLAPLRHSTRQ